MIDDDAISRLRDWLQEAFQATDVQIEQVITLTGGAVQENFAIGAQVTGGPWQGLNRWALRREPPSPLIGSRTKDQEFNIIQAAFRAGVPVPEPFAVCMDAAVIGAPFFVVSLFGGVAEGRKITRDPKLQAYGAALARDVGGALACLHTITPPHSNLAFLSIDERTPVDRRIAMYRQQLDHLPDRHPMLEFALSWLHRNQPADQRYTLVHCDFRTGNYMVKEGKLVGILDWEIADWGEPREDLGYFCAKCWRFGLIERTAGGIASREDFYAGYNAGNPNPVDVTGAPYWEIMGAMRWAIVALLQGFRHLSGEERSLELALTPRIVPEMEFDMLKLIQEMGG